MESSQRTCHIGTTTLHERKRRCVKPNIPVVAHNSTSWPHQIVNTTCPRFALMNLNLHAGLGHRLGEVCSL
jgi:hypothetical protein